jgi:hypothetical protein
MNTMIGRLFELLIDPPVRTDSEIARLLGLDVVALRARLIDLRKRGILAGPFDEGANATWKSWFSTPAAALEALQRSGLGPATPILLGQSWWDGMWAKH